VNGVTTQYLVEDDVNPTGLPQVVEETVNGTVTRSYTYGLERISEAQPINGAWTPSFYEYDGAGSVRQLTNLAANVTVTDTYEYDAFGNRTTTSTAANSTTRTSACTTCAPDTTTPTQAASSPEIQKTVSLGIRRRCTNTFTLAVIQSMRLIRPDEVRKSMSSI
jgi:YD repeat-containing protein